MRTAFLVCGNCQNFTYYSIDDGEYGKCKENGEMEASRLPCVYHKFTKNPKSIIMSKQKAKAVLPKKAKPALKVVNEAIDKTKETKATKAKMKTLAKNIMSEPLQVKAVEPKIKSYQARVVAIFEGKREDIVEMTALRIIMPENSIGLKEFRILDVDSKDTTVREKEFQKELEAKRKEIEKSLSNKPSKKK